MVPLAFCSFVVILVTLERIFILRSKRLTAVRHLRNWEKWFASPMDPDSLPAKNSTSILNQILLPLIEYFPLPRSRFEERLGDLARKQKHKLERGLVFLDTIAGIAPLFGLLGTALGMVEVFSRLSMMGEAKMSALSSGISQALFTTVTGLSIGIPSLMAFNFITRHIENLMVEAEEQLNSLVDEFYPLMIENKK